MMIIGGVKVPFILTASFTTTLDEEISLAEEFDTFGAAKAALEAFILSHEDHVHDYGIGIRRSDLQAGDIVAYPPTFKGPVLPKGTWAISWKKEEGEQK